MGNTTSLSTPPTDIQKGQADIIVWGYIRQHQPIATPDDLIAIIYEYYKVVNRYLLLWSGTSQKSDTRCNQISFVPTHDDDDELKSHSYTLNIRNLKDLSSTKPSIITKHSFDRLHCGHSLASTHIPQWLCKQYPVINTQLDYQMLIRTGGQSKQLSCGVNKCDMILFDSFSIKNQTESDDDVAIDAYYLPLTDLPGVIDHTASIYHNGTIVTIGGITSGHLCRMYELAFTDKHWKWKRNENVPNTERYGSKLCAIHDHNIVIVGGFSRTLSMDEVELYCVGSGDKPQPLPSMTMGRYKPGCYYDGRRQRVFVGGGYNTRHPAKRTVEYLDMHCNSWTRIENQTAANHMFSPVIWMEDTNPDMLYIAGSEIGDHSYDYLDKVECFDMRDSKGWMVYSELDASFPQLLGSGWRSRALLSFCV